MYEFSSIYAVRVDGIGKMCCKNARNKNGNPLAKHTIIQERFQLVASVYEYHHVYVLHTRDCE